MKYKISIITYDDPFAAIVLSDIFKSNQIEVKSVYLAKSQFYKKTALQVVKTILKKSGLKYLFFKSFEFVITKSLILLKQSFSENKIKNIKKLAEEKGLKIKICVDVNSEIFHKQLKKDDSEIIFCIRFNQIIKKLTLDKFRNKFVNFHTSLLPKYKGLASDFRAVLNNEKYIGYSIHLMAPKIDEGKIIFQNKLPMGKNDSVYGLAIKNYLDARNNISKVLLDYMSKKIKSKEQKGKGSYGSWPSKGEVRSFIESKRKYFRFKDFLIFLTVFSEINKKKSEVNLFNLSNDLAQIHKKNHYGKTSKFPLLILRLYFLINLIQKKIILEFDPYGKSIKGYLVHSKSKGYQEIVFLIVSKEFQGKGIGTKLISKLKIKNPKLKVKFDVSNKKLVGFYKKNGFNNYLNLDEEKGFNYQFWRYIK